MIKSRNISTRIKPVFWILLSSIFTLTACAEKKTRIWIDPPTGTNMNDEAEQKLYYQVEDVDSGKKENLIIPIRQLPENLVVENRRGNKAGEAEFALATKADRQISDGKLPESTKVEVPTVSYLRGLSEVEGLYQNQKYADAIVRLAPLIEQYPRQSRLFTMQGTLFRKIGEKKLALDAYKRAQKLEPGNPALEEAVLKSQDEIGENL